MRILLLVDRYLPYPTSQAKLIHDLGVAFVRQGHAVTVVSPSDTLAVGRDVRAEEGLEVVRVRGPRIKGASYALRALHEERLPSLLWRKARPYFLKRRFDLIVFYSPTIFLGRLVARLKRMWGCRTYLVIRDIFPQWVVDVGLLRKGLVWAFFRYRELQQYAVADVIGVEMPKNLDYFREKLPGRNYTLEVLHNWTALEPGPLPKSDLRHRLGLRDEVIFLYGGTVGVAQGVDSLVRLAKAFPRELRAFFLFVGDGSDVERLKAQVAAERIENLRFLPAVPQPEFLAMLAEVDIGLVSLDRRLHNFPSKSLPYMWASLPILACLNDGHGLGRILVDEKAGLVAVNGDDEGLLRSAVTLARDPALRKSMGANARRLLEERFTADVAARKIVASVPIGYDTAPGRTSVLGATP